MPAQCSKGKGMSEALSPARVQNQKGLAAVVNLQRGKKEKKKKKRLLAKNKPTPFILEKV